MREPQTPATPAPVTTALATMGSRALVGQAETPLRRSLARLDTAARDRFVTVGKDVEVIVVDVAERLESRIVVAATAAVRGNALAILGVAVVIGLVAGLWSGPRSSSVSRQ